MLSIIILVIASYDVSVSSYPGSIAGGILMCLLNKTYFDKRADLFVND